MEKVKKNRFILFTFMIFFVLLASTISIAKTEDEENNISIIAGLVPV